MGRTLRHLALGQSSELQIDEAGFDTLLALPLLEVLDLRGTGPLSLFSTNFLANFHDEWLKLHLGAALPNVNMSMIDSRALFSFLLRISRDCSRQARRHIKELVCCRQLSALWRSFSHCKVVRC